MTCLPHKSMTTKTHSQNVCHACRLRKKACNKVLPVCGFCASRGRHCRYDISAPTTNLWRFNHPGKHFVPHSFPLPPITTSQDQTWSLQLPSPESQHDPICEEQTDVHAAPEPLEKSTHQQARYYLKLSKLTRDGLYDHYFDSFHNWLPIVSSDSLRREAAQYRDEQCDPPADFTVLTLAMLLVVLPTLESTLQQPLVSHELLYAATKTAFSQVQVSLCTSLRLIQALLLIAVREYQCTRPEAAYISLTTAAGLARIAKIGISSIGTGKFACSPCESEWEEAETENIAWAIPILERVILCEMDQSDLRPRTEFPGPDCRLPSDLGPRPGLEPQAGLHLQRPNDITESEPDALCAGQFGRQAQSASMLQRLLCLLRLTDSNKAPKLVELAKLDSEIRSFLEKIMAESLSGAKRRICVPIALCVRMLHLLHNTVLDVLRHPESEDDHQRRDISWAALNFVCKMQVDFTDWQYEEKARMIPICCIYNLRAARDHMQERNRLVMDPAMSLEIDRLFRADDGYRKTWVF